MRQQCAGTCCLQSRLFFFRAPPMQIDPTIFKAYDIRGIVGKNVDASFAEHLGRAFGSEAGAAG